MRQVPHTLLIGNGRVARHFSHYFSLLGLPVTTWHRAEPLEKLHQHLATASHILLLISDDALPMFIATHLTNVQATCVHFSGSYVSDKVYGAHPLMTFGNELYTLAQYQSIPFIVDHDAPPFDRLLPHLPNQHVRLNTALKAKYHALCVLSGNFSCLLWQKFFSTLEKEFAIPAAMAFPYLLQQMQNLQTDYTQALTGPLVRNDWQTIAKNQAALSADPFQQVYQSFVACFAAMNNIKP